MFLKYEYGPELASQVVLVVKNLPADAGDIRHMGSAPGSGKTPLKEGMATNTTPVFLPRESHG